MKIVKILDQTGIPQDLLVERQKILFISQYKNIPLSMLKAKKAGNIILKDLLGLRKYYPEKIKQKFRPY